MAARTKQVEKMVEEVNEILKNNHEIDEFSAICHIFSHLLIRTKCYRGFNWFYDVPYTDVTGTTAIISRLCGTSDPNQLKAMHAYIQYY